MTDDYFVASLRGGPQTQADLGEAPRFEYVEQGERAFLRFGNRDGTLATLSEFRLVDGEWTRWRSKVCTGADGGIAVPLVDELALGKRAEAPYPVNIMGGAPVSAVLLDDRQYYNGGGLIRHRSIYLERCERQICVTAIHHPTSALLTQTRARDAGRPRDMSTLFWPADELVGRTNRHSLYVLYDPEDAIAEIRGDLDDASKVSSAAFTDGSWPGTVHAVLLRESTVDAIVVVPRAGEPRSYSPEELPGWTPDG
ncbi:hypothetical protein BH18ACT9_BH18ACT9_06020 [soil metagenome]